MRTFTREFYLPKTHTHKIAAKSAPAVVYLFLLGDRLAAKGFAGKAAKPSFFYTFATSEKRWNYIARWLSAQDEAQTRRNAAKAEKKTFVHTLKVGDVLRSSWGYDQTNIEYYQVTALIGKSMVEVREIGQETESTQWLAGQCVPAPGQYISPVQRKRVLQGNSLDMHNASFGRAYPLEYKEIAGTRVYNAARWSAYA